MKGLSYKCEQMTVDERESSWPGPNIKQLWSRVARMFFVALFDYEEKHGF